MNMPINSNPNLSPQLKPLTEAMKNYSKAIDVYALNLTHTEDIARPGDDMYKAGRPVFESVLDEAVGRQVVKMTGIEKSTAPPVLVYMPNHPKADKNGYVQKSGIDRFVESVNIMNARHSHSACLQAYKMQVDMQKAEIDLLTPS